MAISISTFVSLSSSSPSSLTTNSINQQLTFLQSSSSSSSNIQSFRTLVRNNSIISSSSSSSSSNRTKHRFQVRSISQPNPQPSQFHTKNDPTVPIPQVDSSSSSPSLRVLDTSSVPNTDNNGGSRGGDNSNDGNGNGKCTGGGGGGDGEGDQGDHDDDDDVDEQELGQIMKFEQVIKETKARGVTLPDDMLEAAKTVGIPKILLLRYLDLQGSIWPIGFGMRTCSLLRNRMLADPSFLFKVGIEVLIDSCCATFAEVQKRGENFWAEFELFVADLLVGVVVDIALVGLLAPYVRIGQPSISKGLLGRIQHLNATLPSSVFEAERPGCRFSVQQRVATYFYKGVLYGSVGFVCGLIGQGIANSIMNAKRSIKKSEEDVAVPPLFKSAALWGVFLAVSSNTRYQIVNGLERVVEASPLGKQVPPFAMAFTVGIRFANNIYAGMQFVDWARWSGCQ